MPNAFDHFFASIWNRLRDRRDSGKESPGLSLGFEMVDEVVSGRRHTVTSLRRTTHLAVLGKTGSGKSSLLRHMGREDIRAGRGFVWFDLHGDATPFLLRAIAEKERTHERHLSDRVIVIAPGDEEVSVGFNPLDADRPDFVRVAEFAAILRARWGLDHFGARTDELLRNALYVLSANGMTLLELAPLLTHHGFRAAALKNLPNPEVRQYFEARYDRASDGMKTAMREPILNKTSAFTADPHFRHMVGQQRSTFSMRDAMDRGYWVIADLNKGRLGEHALTLASLLFAVVKSALFTRERRSLFTIYADEMQNFVVRESGVESVLSEARKFGVSVVSANQFLDQYPASMRAAILSVGTHAFFQLSPQDAVAVAQALDGGKSLAERLKNLPTRHFIVKSGAARWKEVVAHKVEDAGAGYADLLGRVRTQSARPRTEVEREIAERHRNLRRSADDVLDAWD
ncbi:MAG: type IV secretory system conjugative DNA transfer family protein [Acidobacteriota bacterium]